MKHLRINAVLLAALCCINASCTTNRVQVDDHSYRVSPPQTTINNYVQPAIQAPPPPTIQQIDREFLQFQQAPTSQVDQVPANYYIPQRTYPPIIPGGLYYPQRQVVYAHPYVRPNYSDLCRLRIRAQLGL